MSRLFAFFLAFFTLAGVAFGAINTHTNTGYFVVTNSVSGDFDAFSWNWSGFDDQYIQVGFDLPIESGAMRLAYGRNRSVFLDVTSVSNFTQNSTNFMEFSVPRTNMPPDGIYYAEFLNFSGSTPTNGLARSYAKGKVIIDQSVFAYTNQSSYVNPLSGMLLGPPTHTIINPEQWPFVSTVTGVYGAAGSTFGVTDTGKAAVVMMSVTGQLPQIIFRAANGQTEGFGLYGGVLGYTTMSSNDVVVTNFLGEQTELDNLSLHRDGTTSMHGDIDMGATNSITNALSIVFANGSVFPTDFTTFVTNMVTQSNYFEAATVTNAYALGIASTALSAVDSALLTTQNTLKAIIDAVSNGVPSDISAALIAVSNTIYSPTANVDLNDNLITNVGSLYATTILENGADGKALINVAARQIVSTGGTTLITFTADEGADLGVNLDVNNYDLENVRTSITEIAVINSELRGDGATVVTGMGNVYVGNLYGSALVGELAGTNASDIIHTADRELTDTNLNVVINHANSTSLVINSQSIVWNGVRATNWPSFRSGWELYDYHGRNWTNPAGILSSSTLVPVGITNVNLQLYTPSTGQVDIIVSYNVLLSAVPNNGLGYYSLYEIEGTSGVSRTVRSGYIPIQPTGVAGSSASQMEVSGTTVRTNLVNGTMYEYKFFFWGNDSATAGYQTTVTPSESDMTALMLWK